MTTELRVFYKYFFANLQKALKDQGYWDRPITGLWDDHLENAMMKFKADNGLRSDRSLIGNLTLDQLEKKANPVSDYPTHLKVALSYVGLAEIPGPKHNQQIVDWWQEVGVTWFDDDETPWCALFVAAVLHESGLPILSPAKLARALAWRVYGHELDGPALGAIAIKHRGGKSSGLGHVGFVAGRTKGGNLAIVSGNANNRVGVDEYGPNVFDYFRYPTDEDVKTGMSVLPVVKVSGDKIVSEV